MKPYSQFSQLSCSILTNRPNEETPRRAKERLAAENALYVPKKMRQNYTVPFFATRDAPHSRKTLYLPKKCARSIELPYFATPDAPRKRKSTYKPRKCAGFIHISFLPTPNAPRSRKSLKIPQKTTPANAWERIGLKRNMDAKLHDARFI